MKYIEFEVWSETCVRGLSWRRGR